MIVVCHGLMIVGYSLYIYNFMYVYIHIIYLYRARVNPLLPLRCSCTR